MRTLYLIVISAVLLSTVCSAFPIENGHWSFQIMERLIAKGFVNEYPRLDSVTQREEMAKIISRLFENIPDETILESITQDDINDIKLLLDEFVAEMASAHSERWLSIRTKISEFSYRIKNGYTAVVRKPRPSIAKTESMKQKEITASSAAKKETAQVKQVVKPAPTPIAPSVSTSPAPQPGQLTVVDEEKRKTEVELTGSYELEYENFSAQHKTAFESSSEYDDGDEASAKISLKIEETSPELDITTTTLNLYKHRDALEKAELTVDGDGKRIISLGENLSAAQKLFGKYSTISKTRGVKVVNKLKDGNLVLLGGKYIQSQLDDISVGGVAYNKIVNKKFTYKISALGTGKESTVTDSGVSVISGEMEYKPLKTLKTVFTGAMSRSGEADSTVRNRNRDGGAINLATQYTLGKATFNHEYEHISNAFEALASATKSAEKNAWGVAYKFTPYLMKKFNYEYQEDVSERSRKIMSFMTMNKPKSPSVTGMYIDQKKVSRATEQDTKIRLAKIGISHGIKTFTPLFDFKRLNVTIDSANYDKQTDTYTLGMKKTFGKDIETNYNYIITNECGTNAYRKRKEEVELKSRIGNRLNFSGKYYHERTHKYEEIEEDFAELTLKYAMQSDIDVFLSFIQSNYNHLTDNTKDYAADGIKVKYTQKFQ